MAKPLISLCHWLENISKCEIVTSVHATVDHIYHNQNHKTRVGIPTRPDSFIPTQCQREKSGIAT